MNDFEKAVNDAQHQAEIHNSRVGGLGGSDADILLRVGSRGLSALTNTDLRRLAVMTGQAEQDNWGGNVYTNAGHLFEDYVANITTADREVKLSAELAHNFKTFAHADFYDVATKRVYECKFVQEQDSNKVIKTYYAQLQYYFIVGAEVVTLVHGTGSADPFNVESCTPVNIERDEVAIESIKNGIKLIDEFVATFAYTDTNTQIGNLDDELQQDVNNLLRVKAQIDELTEQYKTIQERVEAYMTDNNLSKIEAADKVIAIGKPSISRTFDTKKFLAEHAEFDTAEYYKETSKKGSFSIKEAKK